MKLLLVDDEEPLRRLLGKHLESLGIEVSNAENGLEALALAQSEKPDAVLMDLDMPKMNGIQAIRNIRSNPLTTHLPVIVLTGKPTRENVVKAKEAGADGVFVKSAVKLADFPEQLNAIIAKRSRSAQNMASQAASAPPDSIVALPEDRLRSGESGTAPPAPRSPVPTGRKPAPDRRDDHVPPMSEPAGEIPRSRWPLVPRDRVEAKLKKSIDLKALPFVASEIVKITGSSRSDAKDLAETIQRDQALTAQVLKLANSALYGVHGRVQSLTHAVTKIGFGAIRELALVVTLIEEYRGAMMGKRIPLLDFWRHSLTAATLAKEIALAAKLEAESVEGAFLSGLLHDVGQVVLNDQFPEEYRQVLEVASRGEGRLFLLEREAFGFDHPEIAGGVLRKWKFSDALLQPVVLHHRPWSKGSIATSDDVKLTAVLRLASALASTTGLGTDGDEFVEEVPDGVLVQIGIKAEEIERVMGGLNNQVEDLTQILLLHEQAPPSDDPGDGENVNISGKRVAILSQAEPRCDALTYFLKARGGIILRSETIEEAGAQELVDALIVRWATGDWLEQLSKEIRQFGVDRPATRLVVLSEKKLPDGLQSVFPDPEVAILRLPAHGPRVLEKLLGSKTVEG